LQLLGVDLNAVGGLNPAQITTNILNCLAAKGTATLRLAAHSYPSVVAVLPEVNSRAQKHRLETTMVAVSAAFKTRSIPLSIVPINAVYVTPLR